MEEVARNVREEEENGLRRTGRQKAKFRCSTKTREALKMDGKWTKCKKMSIIAIITRMQNHPRTTTMGLRECA